MLTLIKKSAEALFFIIYKVKARHPVGLLLYRLAWYNSCRTLTRPCAYLCFYFLEHPALYVPYHKK